MLDKKQRIGIMGGTFDPIHTSHLVTAEAVRMEYGLDKVLFIPAANPPHKKNSRSYDFSGDKEYISFFLWQIK